MAELWRVVAAYPIRATTAEPAAATVAAVTGGLPMETLEDQELAAAVRVAIAQAIADVVVAQAEAAASRGDAEVGAQPLH